MKKVSKDGTTLLDAVADMTRIGGPSRDELRRPFQQSIGQIAQALQEREARVVKIFKQESQRHERK